MDSGSIIYLPSFIKTGSDIQKLIGVGYIDSMEVAKAYFNFLKMFTSTYSRKNLTYVL
jgi:hypothetical protein